MDDTADLHITYQQFTEPLRYQKFQLFLFLLSKLPFVPGLNAFKAAASKAMVESIPGCIITFVKVIIGYCNYYFDWFFGFLDYYLPGIIFLLFFGVFRNL